MFKKLYDALNAQGFASVSEKLKPYQKQAISIKTIRNKEKDFYLGQSKVGGQPHLPPNFKWPFFDDEPLFFIAQINLSELPKCQAASLLPPTGLLYFFYEGGLEAWGFSLEDEGAAIVHYYEGDLSKLIVTAKPPNQEDDDFNFEYESCRLIFEESQDMPKDIVFYDLENLLSEVDSKKHEQVIEIMENVFYPIDDSDEDDDDENEDMLNNPDFICDESELAKIGEQLSARAAEIIGVPLETLKNSVADNSLTQLRGKEAIRASIKFTKLINSDEEIQELCSNVLANYCADNENGDDNEEKYDENYSGLNKLFGWPDLIQGNVLAESEYVNKGVDFEDTSSCDESYLEKLKSGIKDWILLFQMDSDGNAKMMWGDLGTLYFTIKKEDLAARKFERIWFSMQCH